MDLYPQLTKEPCVLLRTEGKKERAGFMPAGEENGHAEEKKECENRKAGRRLCGAGPVPVRVSGSPPGTAGCRLKEDGVPRRERIRSGGGRCGKRRESGR